MSVKSSEFVEEVLHRVLYLNIEYIRFQK